MKNISFPILWHALQIFLMCIGGMCLIAYIATMHYYLWIPSIIVAGTMIALIYKLEYGYRTRRTFGKEIQ